MGEECGIRRLLNLLIQRTIWKIYSSRQGQKSSNTGRVTGITMSVSSKWTGRYGIGTLGLPPRIFQAITTRSGVSTYSLWEKSPNAETMEAIILVIVSILLSTTGSVDSDSLSNSSPSFSRDACKISSCALDPPCANMSYALIQLVTIFQNHREYVIPAKKTFRRSAYGHNLSNQIFDRKI